MEFKQITDSKAEFLKKNLEHNFYENRFDIRFGDDYDLYVVNGVAVPVHIQQAKHFWKKAKALIGNTFSRWDTDTSNAFYEFIFKKYNVRKIDVFCTMLPNNLLYTFSKKKKNFYPYLYIELPTTIAEFDARLSKRVRYNTKWYPKKIKENFGEYTIVKYDVNDGNNHDIIQKAIMLFFQWKNKTHQTQYPGNVNEYIKEWCITHIYVLSLKNTNEIVAVGMINDVGGKDGGIYFNNFSYNSCEQYRKYSFGMVLFYHIICNLILTQRKMFYLGRDIGKNTEYKKHYGSTQIDNTYSGYIYKTNWLRRKIKQFFH